MMTFLKSILAALLVSMPAWAASTIDPNLPANGVPYSASTIRGQFGAAVNDINALQNLNIGTSAPFTCNLANQGRQWIDDSTSTLWILNICDGSGGTWVPSGYIDTSNHLYTPTTGRGACQTITVATTTDLGSKPESCITASGNSSVSITSLGSTAKPGDIKIVSFNGTNTLVNNATSLILPNGSNATTSNGDIWLFQSLGSGNWVAVSHISQTAATATASPGTGTNVSGFLNAAATSVTISADGFVVCTALSGGTCYELGNYSQIFNSAITGAGGMDTGALPSSGYVCIYAIYNPVTATQSVLGVNCSTSSTTIYGSSHLPSGYTASALLAAWPTNSTPNMVAGALSDRSFFYQAGIWVLLGSTTPQTSPVALSISSAVPPNAKAIVNGILSFTVTASVSAHASEFIVLLPTSTTSSPGVGLNIATLASTAQTWGVPMPRMAITAAQTLYYFTSADIDANLKPSIGINGYSW